MPCPPIKEKSKFYPGVPADQLKGIIQSVEYRNRRADATAVSAEAYLNELKPEFIHEILQHGDAAGFRDYLQKLILIDSIIQCYDGKTHTSYEKYPLLNARINQRKYVIDELFLDNLSPLIDLTPYSFIKASAGQLLPIHSVVLGKNPALVQSYLNIIKVRASQVINSRMKIQKKTLSSLKMEDGKSARGLVDIMIEEEKDQQIQHNLKIIKCILIKAGSKPKYANSTFKSVSATNKKLLNNTRSANYNCMQIAGRRSTARRSTARRSTARRT